MPKPVTLNLVPKSFGDSYFWIAAFKGNEEIGPFGLGNSPTEAVNELVDAAGLLRQETRPRIAHHTEDAASARFS